MITSKIRSYLDSITELPLQSVIIAVYVLTFATLITFGLVFIIGGLFFA